eukprot:jgi/Mesen1/6924/ME000358S06247
MAWKNCFCGGSKAEKEEEEHNGAVEAKSEAPEAGAGPKAAVTPEEANLLITSWEMVEPDVNLHAMNFFLRIFEIAPQATGLFSFLKDSKGPLEANVKLQKHAATVLQTAGQAAIKLGDAAAVEELVPKLVALGERHKGYGVIAAHFAVVKQALLDILEKAFGSAFTDDIKNAWSKAFDILAGTMLKGMAN